MRIYIKYFYKYFRVELKKKFPFKFSLNKSFDGIQLKNNFVKNIFMEPIYIFYHPSMECFFCNNK